MYTLTLLDYTAELLELTYELGALARKYAVPALVAIYVAATLTIEYFRGPSRSRMINKLTQEWERIVSMDPEGDMSESIEFVWFLESLTDEELVMEYQGL